MAPPVGLSASKAEMDISTSELDQKGGLSSLIYHRLFSKISSGEYAQHARLPSENQLAKTYSVSRPVVRDALQRLREDGLIYSRQGSGSYVKVNSHEPVAGFGPVGTIADIQRCYEFRISLEPEAAYYAAQRASSSLVDELERATDIILNAGEDDYYSDPADFDFHYAVAKGANNKYFDHTLMALKDHISIGMRVGGTCLIGGEYSVSQVATEHRAIIDMMRQRDAEGARKAMADHIIASRTRVFEGKLLDLSL